MRAGLRAEPPLPPALSALPSTEHKLQVPGRPLICFAVQKAQSAGFPFLFSSVKLKWGSVSRQACSVGDRAGRRRTLCKGDPTECPGECKDRDVLRVG